MTNSQRSAARVSTSGSDFHFTLSDPKCISEACTCSVEHTERTLDVLSCNNQATSMMHSEYSCEWWLDRFLTSEIDFDPAPMICYDDPNPTISSSYQYALEAYLLVVIVGTEIELL